MTIRDYLKARYRRIMWWFGPIGAVVAVLAVILPTGYWVDWVFILVGGAMLSWFWRYFTSIPCPVCSKPLGKVALPVTNGRQGTTRHCPHCNVSLDAPMPGDA
jgi:hypothetical protein